MTHPRRSVPLRWVAAGILLLALLLAGVVSRFADHNPDGLNRVAQDHGFARTAQGHPSDASPFAGYAHTPVAGVLGVLVVLGLTGGLTLVVRRRARRDQAAPDDRRPVA
jgi:cobalt/nickel transport protein